MSGKVKVGMYPEQREVKAEIDGSKVDARVQRILLVKTDGVLVRVVEVIEEIVDVYSVVAVSQYAPVNPS